MLTILAYLHAFNYYCVQNPRNPEKFAETSNLWSSRSSTVIDIGVNRKPICDLLTSKSHMGKSLSVQSNTLHRTEYKKAQLSLTNPRDAKVCQKLPQFDVLTTLSLTILAYLHSFSCCCVRFLQNPAKFTENSNLWSSRSSKVIDLGVNGKPICAFILVINSNYSRICYRFRDIHG